MSGILDKYDEASSLAYNYTYRMLMSLKNIIENYERLEKRGCSQYKDNLFYLHKT